MSPSTQGSSTNSLSHSSIFGPLSTPIMRFSIYGLSRGVTNSGSPAVLPNPNKPSKSKARLKSERQSNQLSSTSSSASADKFSKEKRRNSKREISRETAKQKPRLEKRRHGKRDDKQTPNSTEHSVRSSRKLKSEVLTSSTTSSVVVSESTSTDHSGTGWCGCSGEASGDSSVTEVVNGEDNGTTVFITDEDSQTKRSTPGAIRKFGSGVLRLLRKCKMGARERNEVAFNEDEEAWIGSEKTFDAREFNDMATASRSEGEKWKDIRVYAEPYSWPHQTSRWGGMSPEHTALIVIDMQKDFLSPHGYLAQQGADIEGARAIIPHIQQLLAFCRHSSFPIYHTREGHRRGLSTMSSQQLFRSRQANSSGLGMGDKGPLGRLLVRGEEGHGIIDELKPYEGDENGMGEEPIIDKPARSAFGYTDFQLLLDVRGVRNLIFCGVTTDQCVLSTMRDANDKGYDCLLVSDACWADPVTHQATLDMVSAEGGILGAVTTTTEVLKAIRLGISPKTLAPPPPLTDPRPSPISQQPAIQAHANEEKLETQSGEAAKRKASGQDLRRGQSRRTRAASTGADSARTEYLEFHEASTSSVSLEKD